MRKQLPSAAEISAALAWAVIASLVVISIPFGLLALAWAIFNGLVEFILMTGS